MFSLDVCIGTVTDATDNALTLSFYHETKPQVAFADKSLCFVGDVLSTNIMRDMVLGSKIHFSAVLDPTSWMPHVWKVVSAWTEEKPSTAFSIHDWDERIAKVYRKWKRFQKWHKRYSPSKDADLDQTKDTNANIQGKGLEDKTICSGDETVKLARKIMLENGKDLKLSDETSLLEIFSSLETDDLKYIQSTYPEISNFFLLHSKLINVTDGGLIYVTLPEKQCTPLFQTIQNLTVKGNDSKWVPSKLGVCLYDSINIHSESSILLFVINVLNMQIRNNTTTFFLNSTPLEHCINYIPSIMKTYILKYHNSLSEFIRRHCMVFEPNQFDQVLPQREEIVKAYVTYTLPKLLLIEKEQLQIPSQFPYSTSIYSTVETTTPDHKDSPKNSDVKKSFGDTVSRTTQNVSPEDLSKTDVCSSQKINDIKRLILMTDKEDCTNEAAMNDLNIDFPSVSSLQRFLFSENQFNETKLQKENEVSSVENTVSKDSHSVTVPFDMAQETSQDASTQTESTGPILSLAQVIYCTQQKR